MAFSDFRLPQDAPDFLTPQTYVNYLHDYVDAFGIRGAIECRAKVIRVSRAPGGSGHVLLISKPAGLYSTWECDAVAVCSGLNVVPNIPKIAGIERVLKVLHSSRLKRREQFGTGTNVVILGAGETTMDLGHLAVTSPTASVTICHRDGFFCAPKVRPPADGSRRRQDAHASGRSSRLRGDPTKRGRVGPTSLSTRPWPAFSTRLMLTRCCSRASCCGSLMTSGSRRCTGSSRAPRRAPTSGRAMWARTARI